MNKVNFDNIKNISTFLFLTKFPGNGTVENA